VPQKRWGATAALNHIRADLDELGQKGQAIRTKSARAHHEALDAIYVRARMSDIDQLINELERLRLAILDQLQHGIEPLLERAAPPLEKRVASLEEQVQRLMNELTIETKVKERQGA
jgi:hypothetical protein